MKLTMKLTMIKMARKSLLSKKGPTRLMRILTRTKVGRYVIRSLFFFYLKNGKKDEEYRSIMSHRDIQSYHIKQQIVDRLRKEGL